jgi:hypothetical protein
MSEQPRKGFYRDDWRNGRDIRQITAPTGSATLGTGTLVAVLPDDAAVDSAATVAALRAEVLKLTRLNRWLLRQLADKRIVNVEG